MIVNVNPESIAIGESSTVSVSGYRQDGSILPDGTIIYFSSSIGSITKSSEVKNGLATAIFRSDDNISGVAKIFVTSGLAEVNPEEISVIIGNAALKYIILNADPQSLPPGGGSSNISIHTFDSSMNNISNIPVIVSTDSGTLIGSSYINYSGELGIIEIQLSTNSSANIKAFSGNISGELKVRVELPPVATFSYSPSNPKINENINFNASASNDSDGNIVEYKWKFGDGKNGSGIDTTHVYSTPGVYRITLSVKDNDGNISVATKDISIAN